MNTLSSISNNHYYTPPPILYKLYATMTLLGQVAGMCYDPSNNLYVADTGNNRFVKLPFDISGTTTGVAYTVGAAINHLAYYGGFVYSTGGAIFKTNVSNSSSSTFNTTVPGPAGIAIDNSGNIFVVSMTNGFIYKITQAGVATQYTTNTSALSTTTLREMSMGNDFFYIATRTNAIYRCGLTQNSNLESWLTGAPFTCWGIEKDDNNNCVYASNFTSSTNHLYKVDCVTKQTSVIFSTSISRVLQGMRFNQNRKLTSGFDGAKDIYIHYNT